MERKTSSGRDVEVGGRLEMGALTICAEVKTKPTGQTSTRWSLGGGRRAH